VRPEQPQFPTDPRRAPPGLSQILGPLSKEEFLRIPITKTVQHEFPAANCPQQRTISSYGCKARLAALSIAWAVRAGRAIPVRWSVHLHPPPHPDSALPLVGKSPHGGADLPPHPARRHDFFPLLSPSFRRYTRNSPPWWIVVSARNTLPTAITPCCYHSTRQFFLALGSRGQTFHRPPQSLCLGFTPLLQSLAYLQHMPAKAG
jgi:hypothetical protein